MENMIGCFVFQKKITEGEILEEAPLLPKKFIFGCENYEYIGDEKRFNKKTGTIEIKQENGTWITEAILLEQKKKEDKLKEQENQEKKLEILNRERLNETIKLQIKAERIFQHRTMMTDFI